jgi:hypothetical protein
VQNGSIPLATVYALFNDPDTLERLGLPALGMGILSPNLFWGSQCIQRGVDSVSLGDGSTLPKVPSLEGNGETNVMRYFLFPGLLMTNQGLQLNFLTPCVADSVNSETLS